MEQEKSVPTFETRACIRREKTKKKKKPFKITIREIKCP